MSQDGVPDPRVRAADADRERIVEQLRQHTADGRLTMDEFEQRMAAAYEAKTYGELAALTADLPVDLSSLSRGGASSTRSGSSTGTGTRTGSMPPADIAAAVIGAAMDFRAQRHSARQSMRMQIHEVRDEVRDTVRAQRHEARMARQYRAPVVAAITGWVTLSVLLTTIWFLSGVTGSGHFSDFWPIWPIAILGILTFGRVAGGAAGRRGR